MKKIVLSLSILVLATLACRSEATPAPLTDPLTGSATEAVLSPSATPFVLGTATPTSLPQGFIVVDSLEQEVYPFVENGKCSLGEAIIAANSGEAKDSCAAGVPGESVISLMPGEYHFIQPDQSPPQFDWLVSIVEVGSALPPVVFPLTIQGNGATLIRDEGVDPFRFFEVMVNGALTLENMTLENGDVLDDWGGAVYASSGSLTLNQVRFVNNHADNGGAVYLTFGALTVQASEFLENHASFVGGGIYADSAKVFVRNTQFIGNTSDSGGGAMSSESVTLVIEDSLFLRNISNGTRGGALRLEHVNVTILRSQFYQNQADWIGGAISINNPVTNGTSDDEGNPLDQVDESPMYIQMATLIPGYQSTLEAHPSGVFQDFYEDTQIHENCFANNIIVDPVELNFSSAIIGKSTNAENNYYGNPSGPSGGGPGTGDGLGRRINFAPFLTEPPAYCDPELSQQVQENHNQ
ncbi:MAG: hypothetical protein J0M11_12370 [Anaerolineae bacterium]|nr:hypothetical protein [Anaerolineae bacterium]